MSESGSAHNESIPARYARDLYRSRNWHDEREYEARFVRAINESIAAATASMERELNELRRKRETYLDCILAEAQCCGCTDRIVARIRALETGNA